MEIRGVFGWGIGENEVEEDCGGGDGMDGTDYLKSRVRLFK